MLKVFNTDALSRNSRFFRGFIAGFITAVVLAVLYGFLGRLIAVEFSLVFIGMGYLIGMAIRHFGRGVRLEFSIMGALLTVFCIVLADFIYYFGINNLMIFSFYPQYIVAYLRLFLRTDINALLSLAFRVGGVYAGYVYSRII